MASEGYVPVGDGVRLYYRLTGGGADAVVIPGAASLAEDMLVLSGARTLIFYDQRGRGRSDAAGDESGVWIDFEVADLERLRDHLGIERMSLVGWSYLGGVAAMYALAHPERVDRLVLMCSIGPRSEAPYIDQEEQRRIAESRLDPLAVKRLEEMRQAGLDVKDPAAYTREHMRVYYSRQMGRPEALAGMRSDTSLYPNEWPRNFVQHWVKHFPAASWQRDWRAELSRIAAPTLVIHGSEDLIPIGSSREWAALLPEARLLVIAGVGHYPHLEAPDVFFPAVRCFLEGEWPEGADAVVPVD